MASRGRTILAFVALGSIVSGCGVYFHDQAVQEQTAKAHDTFKGLDFPGAFNALISAESVLSSTEARSVAANETALREEELAGLVAGQRSGPAATIRLRNRIRAELTALGGASTDLAEWNGLRATRVLIRSNQEEFQAALDVFVGNYRKAGGKDFTSCSTFTVPSEPTLSQLGQAVKDKCGELDQITKQLDVTSVPIQKLIERAPGSAIAKADANLKTAKAELQKQLAAHERTKEELDRAKKALDDAVKANAKLDDAVKRAFANLDKALNNVGSVADASGQAEYSPGAVLAKIQFRKVTVRDVIAAGASLGPDAAAASTNAQKAASGLVGAIVGIAKFDQMSQELPTAPSLGELGIALAFEEGLEGMAQVEVDAIRERMSIRQDHEDALVREYELLAMAHTLIEELDKAGLEATCSGYTGFGELFRGCKSSDVRLTAGRALSAYNLSWPTGGPPPGWPTSKRHNSIA